MADLVRGGYPVSHSLRKFTGLANASQANLVARSNQEWVGVASADTAAIAASGTAVAVAVPVEIGDVISRITVLVGATAAGTPTNAFAAVYSGLPVPALLSQSTSSGAGVVNASGAFTFVLATPVTATYATAPTGYLYVSLAFSATVMPSVATTLVAAAVGYKAFPNSPLFLAATHGTGLSTTAPATITTPTTISTVPVVYLT